jgi:hypothetical protein
MAFVIIDDETSTAYLPIIDMQSDLSKLIYTCVTGKIKLGENF